MERLKIAIAGGGIASLCLAHSLTTKHPQWEIKIFEASPQLREEGAAIGLAANAQEALNIISPSLREALDEAGGVPCVPSGTGPNSGQHIGDVSPPTPQITVHRTAFWTALYNRMPSGVLEWGKKLTSISTNPSDANPITLTFADSTTASFDALVGCDGINSTVRLHVLGADHVLMYTHGYNHRIVVPLAEAEAAFGKEYCSVRTQTGWIGEGGFLLTDHCDEGRSMQVIAGWSNRGPWPFQQPFVEWDQERLKKDLEDWGDIGSAMLKESAGRIHPPTLTYNRGPVCLAGDAAQSFPPFQGAGAGQAIEDALILSTVLGLVTEAREIPLAFQSYNSLRNPRRAAIAQSSLWTGKVMTGMEPDVGLDMERLREVLPRFQRPVLPFDLQAHQREAVEMFEEAKGSDELM